MRHINSNSINNISKQSDTNKSDGTNQASSAQKAANAKLLQSMQSKTQGIRSSSQDNQTLVASKNNERNQYLKDFDKTTRDAQAATDNAVNKFKESVDLTNSSFSKKGEANVLNERAKSESEEVAADLKQQAKDKSRESTVDQVNSNKAQTKSLEQDSTSQELNQNATNLQEQANSVNNQSAQDQAKSGNLNSQEESLNTNTANLNSKNEAKSNNTAAAGDVSGGSAYSGGFSSILNSPTNGYNGFDQSYADDWKNGTGIYTPAGAYSTYTGNGAENLNNGNASGGAGSGGSGGGGSADGTANNYLQAAKALLKQIGEISKAMSGNANPIIQIAKNLTNKGLSEQAVAYLEAAQVDSTIGGAAINQDIILTKAQASTIKGDSDTNINYWKETLADNKQMGKATHDLAKMA